MAISELVKETIVGILYGIFLWAARASSSSSSSSMGSNDGSNNGSGLSVALRPEGENASQGRRRILHSCMAAVKKPSALSSFFTWLPSETSSSWTSSTTGDLIGTESGVHMTSGEDAVPWENPQPSTCRQSSRVKKEEKKWDIPPPITLLQGRGDYTGPLPWFLTREYVNGRLILKEATVEHFEYLEATRADGRLRMNLVAVDNTANCCHTNEEDNGEIVEEDDDQEQISTENGNEVSAKNDEDEEKSLLVLDDMDQNGMPFSFAASLPETTVDNVMKEVETFRKCLTYTEGLASRNFLDQYNSQPSSPQLF